MKRVILTSNLGGSEKIDGLYVPARLEEGNGQLDLIKTFWKEEAKVLFITASPDDAERNSSTIRCFKDAFPMSGLSVSEILMCDRENMALVDDLSGIDVIILTGGHVPTENVFFKELGLREKLWDFDGLVIAWSAGSMNCADTVYAGPEIPGEAVDPDFKRWITGLGLTKINIFPHFSDLRYDMLDGMRLIEDITFSDSMGHEIIAINNGSYIVCEEDGETVYGEAYRILDGKIEQICEDGKSVKWTMKEKVFPVITEDDFFKKMMVLFPEKREDYEKHVEKYGERLSTVIMDFIFAPEIVELIGKDPSSVFLKEVFAYFENVAENADSSLREVFVTTIMEVLGNDEETLRRAGTLMGPKTRELQSEADRGLGRKRDTGKETGHE